MDEKGMSHLKSLKYINSLEDVNEISLERFDKYIISDVQGIISNTIRHITHLSSIVTMNSGYVKMYANDIRLEIHPILKLKLHNSITNEYSKSMMVRLIRKMILNVNARFNVGNNNIADIEDYRLLNKSDSKIFELYAKIAGIKYIITADNNKVIYKITGVKNKKPYINRITCIDDDEYAAQKEITIIEFLNSIGLVYDDISHKVINRKKLFKNK